MYCSDNFCNFILLMIVVCFFFLLSFLRSYLAPRNSNIKKREKKYEYTDYNVDSDADRKQKKVKRKQGNVVCV